MVAANGNGVRNLNLKYDISLTAMLIQDTIRTTFFIFMVNIINSNTIKENISCLSHR